MFTVKNLYLDIPDSLVFKPESQFNNPSSKLVNFDIYKDGSKLISFIIENENIQFSNLIFQDNLGKIELVYPRRGGPLAKQVLSDEFEFGYYIKSLQIIDVPGLYLRDLPNEKKKLLQELAVKYVGKAIDSNFLIEIYKLSEGQEPEKSLYDRLGGIFSIALVINHFSDALIVNPLVGQNSPNKHLRDWSREKLDRLPGLKWMRTLWLVSLAGGPYTYVPTRPGKCPFGLENAHAEFEITPAEFDEVAAELSRSLDHFEVPAQEKSEVLNAFAGHKPEVTHAVTGSIIKCPFK